MELVQCLRTVYHIEPHIVYAFCSAHLMAVRNTVWDSVLTSHICGTVHASGETWPFIPPVATTPSLSKLSPSWWKVI